MVNSQMIGSIDPTKSASQDTRPVQPWKTRGPCCERREATFVVKELSVRYGRMVALDGVSLPIYRGCITAVVGPSGCGKSSFLSSLNRMTDLIPQCVVGGSIHLDGQDIHDPHVNVTELRRKVGMIFQKPVPFPLSIIANLTFPLKQHGVTNRQLQEEKAESALRQVGLWDEVKDRLASPALSLSGGQQQRLCLARTLALEPEVILLDEPCSALDPIASGVVEDLILSLRGKYTVVIVTHNLAQARRIADDVALFWVEDGVGTLIEHGPIEEVFDAPQHGITAEYLRGARG